METINIREEAGRIEVIKKDITEMEVDAIVNAANKSLEGGGGVDGAIHRAAGPDLLEEAKTLGGAETGEAKLTKGYKLPASYVIHTVGPVYQDGKHREQELLSQCYHNSIDVALENNLKTIAFPSISTGAYHYPLEEAAKIAFDSVLDKLVQHDEKELEKIYFVTFDNETYQYYQKLYDLYFA